MPERTPRDRRPSDHRVVLEASPERVRVSLAGTTVADTKRSLVVRETGHAPVLYIPREDVRLELMERTRHETFCPYKGVASYWTLRVGDRVEENVAWSYEQPLEEVAGLAGHVSFYADRVDWEGGSVVSSS